MASTVERIIPFFTAVSSPAEEPEARPEESPAVAALITTLGMLPHIEGGYFVETDRDPSLVPSPFPLDAASAQTLLLTGGQRPGFDPQVRNASTSIYYLLTPGAPQGNFHWNRARTVHTLHKGRGRYVLLHGAGGGEAVRVETFVVGQDVSRGEKLQWIVEGDVYKASFLLPDQEGAAGSEEGLLISETVVPGFEYCDHDFLTREGLVRIMGEARAKELEWLVRTGE